jgi:carbonic anhydrase
MRSRTCELPAWIGACACGFALGWLVPGAGPLPPHVSSGGSWGQHAPRRADDVHPEASAPAAERATDAASVSISLSGSRRPSLVTPFSPRTSVPTLPATAYVDPFAVLLGDVRLGENVFVAPFVSIRADEGEPIAIGAESNVQDGAVIHGLPTSASGEPLLANRYVIDGTAYSVYVAERVSIEHQAQVHGPAWIEKDVWIGMQALVARSRIGEGSVIEPRAVVLGVSVAAGRFVPAGVIVSNQDVADRLPEITPSYALRRRNQASVHASRALAAAYVRATR